MRHETDTSSPWGTYEQLDVEYDPDQKAVWYHLAPHSRPCFNLDLLGELKDFQDRLVAMNRGGEGDPATLPVRYTVLASRTPGVFNLGGDLQLFAGLIRAQDRDGLFHYAKSCIDVLYPNTVNFDQPLTTITLVQGDALGGGFEAAISSNVVIAERSAKFGLPEVLFNLIPGMGAYSFLIRKTSPATAERIIMSGELLSADEMFELGLVDVVVEDGEGEEAAVNFIHRHRKRGNSHVAMGRIRQCVNPVTYDELIRITRIWVDAALNLTDRDLRMIERLVQAQNRRAAAAEPAAPRAMEGHG
ncbi:crotonase/enoyl-CoA hydratase family protein [bacterium]|nr:crotonase/enoyl-CoA hydratase family protein [bacterium]